MTGFWSPAPVLVAGPCVAESAALVERVAAHLAELAERLGLRVVFKASFDKANRSGADAARGLGIERGLEALARARETSGLPVLTDVHEAWQVERAAPVVDALQIPAFLCRQTDLLAAAGGSGRPVNVKKGQWMAPADMAGAVDKVRRAGGTDVAVTERGTFFGYGDLVVDVRSFAALRRATGAPVLFDATHAVQQPGQGPGGASGGRRDDVPALLLAAAAAGVDGFFLETHPTPETALSDGATMWPLADLEPLIRRALAVRETARAEGRPAWSSR